ncbi:MAG TPA: DNA-3-methyladenine glycosylase [Fimbriiglobus sp.]|jgi:DNA-3-methyladenine glycosylase II
MSTLIAADHSTAVRHLTRRCTALKLVIRRVGACQLVHNPDSFRVLASSIISQQISTKAATSIRNKVIRALGGRLHPNRFDRVTDEDLRACGLSAGKVKFLRDLVAKTSDGTIPLRRLPKMADDDVRQRLLEVNGIGPWTVDMFLMFGLGRPDILPTGDLGIRVAAQKIFGLDEPPKPADLTARTEHWRPFRTIACWYLWRSLDGNAVV